MNEEYVEAEKKYREMLEIAIDETKARYNELKLSIVELSKDREVSIAHKTLLELREVGDLMAFLQAQEPNDCPF